MSEYMKIKLNKAALVLVASVMLVSCGKGDTSVETLPVTSGAVPAAFVGTYTGTIRATAKKGLLESSATDPVSIVVRSNNTVEFRGDDPDEAFTATIGANGNFNGVLPINTGDCTGNINVSGTVNGVTATGNLGGEGRCSTIGSVGVSGSFSARK